MVNSWISHVKHYAATHHVPYPVAMIQAKASYKKMSGGMTLKEFGLERWDSYTPEQRNKMTKDANKIKEIAGFGVKRGRPRKMKGGMTLKDWGLEQYDRIPDAYKPGLESLGEAAYHQAGFGLVKRKRGRPRKMKGGDVFSDMKNAFDPDRNGLADAFRPGGPAEDFGKQIASELIHQGIPITTSTTAAAAAAAAQPGNPLSPMLAGYAGQKAGEQLANYVGDQTGYGVMSDALAYAKQKGKLSV